MTDQQRNERIVDCKLRIKEITDSDGITVSKATILQNGIDIEVPVIVLYNGPPTLGQA